MSRRIAAVFNLVIAACFLAGTYGARRERSQRTVLAPATFQGNRRHVGSTRCFSERVYSALLWRCGQNNRYVGQVFNLSFIHKSTGKSRGH